MKERLCNRKDKCKQMHLNATTWQMLIKKITTTTAEHQKLAK